MRKDLFIVFIISFAIFLFSIFFFLFYGKAIQYNENSYDCNLMKYSGESAYNLLFFADESTSKSYSEFLLSSSPFSMYPDSFNVYYIDSYNPECDLYKGIALLCYNRNLIKASASCPDIDYVFVINQSDITIRSSSYLNVMSLNFNHQMSVIMHEFGHSFVGLAEEYVNDQNPPPRSRNCVSSCSAFNISEENCFLGCSRSSLFRSVENGIMRTLTSEYYGDYNEAIIIEKIRNERSVISGNPVQDIKDCSDKSYYLIEGIILSDSIMITRQSLEKGCPLSVPDTGDYSFTLYTDSGEIAISQNFSPILFTDIQQDGSYELSGEIYYDNIPFIITLPSGNYSKLDISDGKGNTISGFISGGNLACHL